MLNYSVSDAGVSDAGVSDPDNLVLLRVLGELRPYSSKGIASRLRIARLFFKRMHRDEADAFEFFKTFGNYNNYQKAVDTLYKALNNGS